MADDDYEIIPLKEVEKLKHEIEQLKEENKNSPMGGIAGSLDRLTTSLEKLFEIFNVAATDIEEEKLEEKGFEEKIQPILQKLKSLEEQNRDIAEGILALADILKKQHGSRAPLKPLRGHNFSGLPNKNTMPPPGSAAPTSGMQGPLPPKPGNDMPPPPPRNG